MNAGRIIRTLILTAWAAAAALTMWAIADAALFRSGPLDMRDFVFYPGVAADARRLVANSDARVLTDSYQIAAPLAYYGIPTVLLGNTAQARMWDGWFGSAPPRRAVVLTLAPADRSGVRDELKNVYARVAPGSTLRYGGGRFTVYVYRCDEIKQSARLAAPSKTKTQTTR